MILKDEIQEVATQKQLAMNVIEKDYVLSWVLAGIHHHAATKNSWIFKGGTCLKKCYFETFRFSEDLDFTYCGEAHEPNEEFYKNIFLKITKWVYNNSGIELPDQGIEFEIFNNKRGSMSVQGKLSYRGPLRPDLNISGLPRIKIDLTLDEPLLLDPLIKNIDHPYSDRLEEGKKILSYSYEEIFAEKLRALIQRLRPRDLYDVIHLFRRQDLHPNLNLLNKTLQKKCKIRNIPFPTIALIENHDNRKLLESEWGTQLQHQLPTLPPFKIFLDELADIFNWISEKQINTKVAPSIEESIKNSKAPLTIIQESIQSLVIPGQGTTTIEKIRFAAANRLLLDIGYNDSKQKAEAYTFARSPDGDLLLCAFNIENHATRRYRIDCIQSLKILTEAFTPQFQIEITSGGLLPVYQLT